MLHAVALLSTVDPLLIPYLLYVGIIVTMVIKPENALSPARFLSLLPIWETVRPATRDDE